MIKERPKSMSTPNVNQIFKMVIFRHAPPIYFYSFPQIQRIESIIYYPSLIPISNFVIIIALRLILTENFCMRQYISHCVRSVKRISFYVFLAIFIILYQDGRDMIEIYIL